MNWKSRVADLGCVVCRNMGLGKTPAQLHHPYGRKGAKDNVVLPVCFSHHQAGVNNALFVSRHPYKAEWVRRYGTEADLLKQVEALLA